MTVGQGQGQYAVEIAVRNTLRTWLRTYVVAAARRNVLLDPGYMSQAQLEELLRNTGPDGLPFAPRSPITVAASFDDWRTDSLPQVQVLSPAYSAAGGDERGLAYRYEIQVLCLVGAQDHADTRFLRACYEDAIPGAVMQNQDLGGIAETVRHIGGGAAAFDEISEQDSRTFQGSMSVFEVLVTSVLDPWGGPALPDPLPDDDDGVPPVYPPDGTVEETVIGYLPRPVDEPVDPDA